MSRGSRKIVDRSGVDETANPAEDPKSNLPIQSQPKLGIQNRNNLIIPAKSVRKVIDHEGRSFGSFKLGPWQDRAEG
jgi:hypothetical protein